MEKCEPAGRVGARDSLLAQALLLAALVLPGCSAEENLAATVEVALPQRPAARAPAAAPGAAPSHCETALETAFVPLRARPSPAGSLSATAIRVSGDRCVLLVGAGSNPDQRPLQGAAVAFAVGTDSAQSLVPAELAQFQDCVVASEFRLYATCPGGLPPLVP